MSQVRVLPGEFIFLGGAWCPSEENTSLADENLSPPSTMPQWVVYIIEKHGHYYNGITRTCRIGSASIKRLSSNTPSDNQTARQPLSENGR